MGRGWIVGLVLGIALGFSALPPASAYYSSTWFEDADGYEAAVRQQRYQHVPMLIYFRVDWCPHCRELDGLLEQSQVRSRLAELIKVRINPEHGDAEKRLYNTEFGGSGYPSVFVRPDGGSPTALRHSGPAERFLGQLPQ
jgi:thiol:disulfide interchange protein